MYQKTKVALLDYDDDPQAIIQPDKNDYDFTLPNTCVAIFFKDVVEELSHNPYVTTIGSIPWETGKVVYYLYKRGNLELCFYHAWVGSSISAAVMDLSIALGAKRIIACGGCGVLNSEIAEGRLLIPTSAIRDEGTSFHYVAPSSEIVCSSSLLNELIDYLNKHEISFIPVKTWTTDGFYRETSKRRALRVEQECVTVDMEFSALCAVSQFRRVDFAQIFYSGDVIEIPGLYDERDWQNDKNTRNSLVKLIFNFLEEKNEKGIINH